MNNENELRNLIIKSVPKDIHLVDIPDEGKRLIKLLPESAAIIAKMIALKPYDLGLLFKGKYCALELKNVDNSLTFNPALVKDHQIAGLLGAVKARGLRLCGSAIQKGIKSFGKKKIKNTVF